MFPLLIENKNFQTVFKKANKDLCFLFFFWFDVQNRGSFSPTAPQNVSSFHFLFQFSLFSPPLNSQLLL